MAGCRLAEVKEGLGFAVESFGFVRRVSGFKELALRLFWVQGRGLIEVEHFGL